MKIHFKGKRIEIPVKKTSKFRKVSGLMFRTRNTEKLLFEFSNLEMKNIHSYFVFFKFLAVWLDDKNRVLRVDEVDPFTLIVRAPKNTRKLVEIPLNNQNRWIFDFFVDKREKFKYASI